MSKLDPTLPPRSDAPEETVTVEPEDSGLRADVILGRQVPGLSRRIARKLALDGRLTIDGRRCAPSTRPPAGAHLRLQLPQSDIDTDPSPLDVIKTSADFIYVNKPPGMHTVAATPKSSTSLSALVANQFVECAAASPNPLESGAVHRLDQDTSGVVAFARNRDAWHKAREAFGARTVEKHYLALSCMPTSASWPPSIDPDSLAESLPDWLRPCPPLRHLPNLPRSRDFDAVALRAPLGAGQQRNRVAVRMDGRNSCTRVQLLDTFTIKSASSELHAYLVHLELATGHRHQARVHLAWAGLPILGDRLYGRETVTPNPERLHLHAVAIDFSQAFPGEELVSCPAGQYFFKNF